MLRIPNKNKASLPGRICHGQLPSGAEQEKMPSVQPIWILHRRHFSFYFSITTVLSVSAGRSTRMICPSTRRKQPESSFVRFSRITT